MFCRWVLSSKMCSSWLRVVFSGRLFHCFSRRCWTYYLRSFGCISISRFIIAYRQMVMERVQRKAELRCISGYSTTSAPMVNILAGITAGKGRSRRNYGVVKNCPREFDEETKEVVKPKGNRRESWFRISTPGSIGGMYSSYSI